MTITTAINIAVIVIDLMCGFVFLASYAGMPLSHRGRRLACFVAGVMLINAVTLIYKYF